MTEIEKKKLIARLRARTDGRTMLACDPPRPAPDRDCHAAADLIEQHEAFRQEVSDAAAYLTGAVDRMASQPDEKYRQTIANDIRAIFARFIIAKPDPMDLVADDMMLGAYNPRREWGAELRAAIEKRGGKIIFNEEQN